MLTQGLNYSQGELDGSTNLTEENEGLTVEYIAHASFKLTYNGSSILLDPYADSIWISYTFPKNISADAIFSTHPHYDHDGGIFRNLKPYWEGQFPFYQDPGTYLVGEFKVTGVKGKHCDPYGKEFGQKNTIFIIEVGDLTLAHWGDNGPITDDIEFALQGVDILFLPIDDTYHILKKDETQEVIEKVSPKVIIPMHYRIDDLEPDPNRPVNLGPITEYMKDHKNVRWIDSNQAKIQSINLPEEQVYYVFEHSPIIPKPSK